jgi:hypothetical protein
MIVLLDAFMTLVMDVKVIDTQRLYLLDMTTSVSKTGLHPR